jgi:hypothetical protein
MIEYRGEKFKDYNKPKLTPKHPTKKAAVLARFKRGDKTIIKIIRFGAQGMGHNYSAEARKRFKTRFRSQIAKAGKDSAMYWANKFLWGGPKGIKKNPPKES